MADNHIWVSTDGDWGAEASWHDATVPIATDTASFLSGAVAVSAGLDQSAVNTVTVVTGEGYRGAFGSSGNPLLTGTGWTFLYRGRNVSEAFFEPGNGAKFLIKSTSDQENACVIDGGGNTCIVNVTGARNLVLAAGLTLDELRVLAPGCLVRLTSGLTLVDAFLDRGLVICDAALTNCYVRGGRWVQQGPLTHDITLLRITDGLFELSALNMTLGTLDAVGGHVNGSLDEGVKTISAGVVWPRALVNLDNGADTITAALTRRGGKIHGGSNVTITEEVPEMKG